MLPNRGTCHGVFLLVHSARSAPRRSLDEWVDFARGMPTVMAAAVDLGAVASSMFDSGLAKFDGQVRLDPRLLRIGNVVTDDVLMQIAVILLESDLPPWLHGACSAEGFQTELVPSVALNALEWMSEDIHPILVAAKRGVKEDDGFKVWLGGVGESLVVETEKHNGASVRHVSLISDFFGYDVETVRPGRFRLEVKTSVLGSEGRVFLTRNEVTSARKHGAEWFLVQVVLKAESLTVAAVTQEHVVQVRKLSSAAVLNVLPQDSDHCRWVETVELSTSALPWESYFPQHSMPLEWTSPGLPH